MFLKDYFICILPKIKLQVSNKPFLLTVYCTEKHLNEINKKNIFIRNIKKICYLFIHLILFVSFFQIKSSKLCFLFGKKKILKKNKKELYISTRRNKNILFRKKIGMFLLKKIENKM